MSTHVAKVEHEIAYQDMVAMVRRHEHLSPLELLAIAANMVGKLVALQDQRSTTPAQAMAVVAQNIQLGNQQAVEELMHSAGSA